MFSSNQKSGYEEKVFGVSNATSVIGAQTVIEGNIKLEEAILIQGKVYGDLEGNVSVTIDAAGVVMGKVACQTLKIAGRVIGNVEISGTLHIMTKGHLKGDADVHSLLVDDGADFNGRCTMKEQNDAPMPISLKGHQKI